MGLVGVSQEDLAPSGILFLNPGSLSSLLLPLFPNLRDEKGILAQLLLSAGSGRLRTLCTFVWTRTAYLDLSWWFKAHEVRSHF